MGILLLPPLFCLFNSACCFFILREKKKNRLFNPFCSFIDCVWQLGFAGGAIGFLIGTSFCNSGNVCPALAYIAGSIGSAIGVISGLFLWIFWF
ncbi:MAG: hypothetical protein ACU84H_16450 [Gammaproteobacteria bacterium]